jgi:hypothetical protein
MGNCAGNLKEFLGSVEKHSKSDRGLYLGIQRTRIIKRKIQAGVEYYLMAVTLVKKYFDNFTIKGSFVMLMEKPKRSNV